MSKETRAILTWLLDRLDDFTKLDILEAILYDNDPIPDLPEVIELITAGMPAA